MNDNLNLGKRPIVNPLRYPTLHCDNCNNEFFEEKIIIKQIPGVIAGTGTEDVNYPVPVLVCSKCGAIEPRMRELIEKGDKEQTEKKENTSGLIL